MTALFLFYMFSLPNEEQKAVFCLKKNQTDQSLHSVKHKVPRNSRFLSFLPMASVTISYLTSQQSAWVKLARSCSLLSPTVHLVRDTMDRRVAYRGGSWRSRWSQRGNGGSGDNARGTRGPFAPLGALEQDTGSLLAEGWRHTIRFRQLCI